MVIGKGHNTNLSVKQIRKERDTYKTKEFTLLNKNLNIIHYWLVYHLKVNINLKGQLHEIFDPRFFHQSTPPRALIHGLKPFRIWLRIRQANRFESRKKLKIKSRIPQVKICYGDISYEIVLQDIPFPGPKRLFEISAGSYEFQRGQWRRWNRFGEVKSTPRYAA
jgi:hypothetical protein